MIKNKNAHLYIIISAVIGVFLVGGLVVAVFLSQNQQDNRQQASVPGGPASVGIAPTSAQLQPNGSTTFTVSFNPNGLVISGVSVRLQYPISGSTPILVAGQPNPIITQNNSSWTCPVKTTNTTASLITIDVGCLNLSTTGFTAQTDTPLFTVTTTAGTTATTSPITISFDPIETVITTKANNEDIVATPTSVATVSILSSATPTPTRSVTPTASPPTNQGKQSKLGYNASCTTTNIEATMDLTNNNQPVSNVTVSFVYQGATQTATSNANGRASTLFAKNGNGTLSASASGFNSQSTTVVLPTDCPNSVANTACNITCIANRDCSGGLICSSGRCRSDRCPTDSTCACHDFNAAAATNTTELPDSGSLTQTLFTLILGSMLLIGSSSVLLAQIKRES